MMLKLEAVSARYGPVEALKGVDMDVKTGEIVTLIGANGAGKTTLMMTICGQPRAAAGKVLFNGEDITALPTDEIVHRGIALVPEGRRIFARLTVYENLQLGALVADEKYSGRYGARLHVLPALEGTPHAARWHAFRRGAADAGHWPGPHEPPQAFIAR